MSHRGEPSSGSIFIYLGFVVFLEAETTLSSQSRSVETLTAKTVILKDGRRRREVEGRGWWRMEGGEGRWKMKGGGWREVEGGGSDGAVADGEATADQKQPGSQAQSHRFQALSRRSSCLQLESCLPGPGDREKMEFQNLEAQLWAVRCGWSSHVSRSHVHRG